jgi:hypothetical protein
MDTLIISQLKAHIEQLKEISNLVDQLQDRQQRFLDNLKEQKSIIEGRDIEDWKINA